MREHKDRIYMATNYDFETGSIVIESGAEVPPFRLVFEGTEAEVLAWFMRNFAPSGFLYKLESPYFVALSDSTVMMNAFEYLDKGKRAEARQRIVDTRKFVHDKLFEVIDRVVDFYGVVPADVEQMLQEKTNDILRYFGKL